MEKVDSTGTTKYFHDGLNVLAEYNETGTLKARYTQSLEIDKPISMTRSVTTSYYHFDGLGSVTALTDTDGNITDAYTYEAFGNLVASTGTTVNPYRFTARELDSDSGLMYYRARYYSPPIGRFITHDPFRGLTEDPLRLNRYIYCRNNPVNYVDPKGLQCGPGAVGDWGIFDQGLCFNFEAACAEHDSCYKGEEGEEGCEKTKGDCDSAFLNNMLASCNEIAWWNFPCQNLCQTVALTYYSAVDSLAGWGAFLYSRITGDCCFLQLF